MIVYSWLETWAQYKVIGMWIGLGFLALCLLIFLVYVVCFIIKWEYKKHSKKYKWDSFKRDYVRKDDKNESNND